MADDIDKLIAWARSQGWTVEIDANGYRRFHAPDGTYVVRYPATPSNPRRRLLDVVSAARRYGLAWPLPSRKEQRPEQEGRSIVNVTEWRVEVRVQVAVQVSDPQLDELMSSTAIGDFGDDVDVARDPIGLVLFGHVLDPDSPADGLARFWASAQKWLAAVGVDGVVADGRVCTDELFADEVVRPDTAELVGPGEVAELLGVSRQRVHQLSAQHPDFPAPYARLGIGSVWTRPAVEAFERRWSRKPGRPARAAG